MINKLNFSTSDYHRKLQTSVLLLLLSCLAFVFIPYIVADANAETADVNTDWSKIILNLDTGSNSGDVDFNGGTAITPDEAGVVATERKTLTVSTSGKHFHVYLSADSSVSDNNKLCFDFDSTAEADENPCDGSQMGINPIIETSGAPTSLAGNDWGYAVVGDSNFSDASVYVNNRISDSELINNRETDSAKIALYNAKFAAVPTFTNESLIWTGNTENPNGFGSYVIDGETRTGDSANTKTLVYGVKVNNNLVAGTYGTRILYTAVASASDLNTPSTNIISSLMLGGPTDVTKLTMDIDAEGAKIKEKDIKIRLIKQSDAAAADSNHDDKYSDAEIEAAWEANFDKVCLAVAHSLDNTHERSMSVSCVLPDLGLNEGTDYDFIVKVPITGGLTRKYISYKPEGEDVGAIRYVGLQTLNSNNEPYVDTMQGITAGICSMTNTWGTGTGSDARIYNRTGTGVALANTAEDSNALGLGTFALEDIRDNKEYLVRRLADGNCWMVQNLDLELADFAESDDLTPSNTDISYGLSSDDAGYRASWDPSASYKSNDYGTFSTFSDWSNSVVGMMQQSQFQTWEELGNKSVSGNSYDYAWGSAKDANGNVLSSGEKVRDGVWVANNIRSQIPRSYSNMVGEKYRYIPTNPTTGARTGYSPQTKAGDASDNPLAMTPSYTPKDVASNSHGDSGYTTDGAGNYYGNMYVGNYYNWYAATAESGVYNSTNNLTVEGSAKDSICPKGWQLPINGPDIAADSTNYTDKSWNKLIKGSYGLITSYGEQGSTTPSNSMQEVPLSIILSGHYNWVSGNPSNRGHYGVYWASTPSSANYSRHLYFNSTGVYPQSGNYKVFGITVRCVARGTEVETVAEEETATTCEAGKICYGGNGSTGTMSDQTASASSDVMLTAPTYNKLGYAFVGWNTQENGFGTTYQADETITTPSTLNSEGLQLYAKWLPSAGEMQNWSGCSTLGEHQTVALTDNRDGKTYAVRKLKDGNCWMVNNLNLELANFAGTNNLTSDNTDLSTSRTDLTDLGNGKKAWDPSASTVAKYQSGETFSDFTLRVLGQSQPAQFQSEDQTGYWWGSKKSDDGNYTDLDSVTNNTNAEIPRSYNAYEEGFYNWYAATAESGTYSMSNASVSDSICPKGWQLPINGNVNKSYYRLIETTYQISSASQLSNNPLSIVKGGFYDYVTGNYAGIRRSGSYWTSTAFTNNSAYNLYFINDETVGTTASGHKPYGNSVRCVNRD